MATIAIDQDLVTLVNVFIVNPEQQQRLAAVLAEATTTVMNRFPGYLSANIHRSLDGTRVVNYAQWRRVEDFEAMVRDPIAQQHMRSASKLATSFEPHLYEVVFTDQAADAYAP